MAVVNVSIRRYKYKIVGWKKAGNQYDPITIYENHDKDRVMNMFNNLKPNKDFVQYDIIQSENTLLGRK